MPNHTDQKFPRLFSMHFLYASSHVFGWTLSTFYFIQRGYSFLDISIYFILSFIASVFIIAHIRNFRTGKSMRLGLVIKVLVFFVASWLFVKPLLFLTGILWGIMTVYYWIPLNILFFKYRNDERNATNSGIYFLIWPVLGAVLPALAGIVANYFRMIVVFLVGALLLIPAMMLSLGIRDENQVSSRFSDFIGNTKGIKTLVFLQGIWKGVEWVTVPLVTLVFIRNEVDYGIFYAYLGVFGVIAFLLMAPISDRLKKGRYFSIQLPLLWRFSQF